ncbi:hypothetical protein L1887_35049 [Cichorium endivia]|nr:hypothetical protein L1887_35049 [Cichorium endivia]
MFCGNYHIEPPTPGNIYCLVFLASSIKDQQKRKLVYVQHISRSVAAQISRSEIEILPDSIHLASVFLHSDPNLRKE